MGAYQDLLTFSPTASSNQPLLTFTTKSGTTTVTVKMLSSALRIMLQALKVDYELYYFHSLRKGGPRLPTNREPNKWPSRDMDYGHLTLSGST